IYYRGAKRAALAEADFHALVLEFGDSDVRMVERNAHLPLCDAGSENDLEYDTGFGQIDCEVCEALVEYFLYVDARLRAKAVKVVAPRPGPRGTVCPKIAPD